MPVEVMTFIVGLAIGGIAVWCLVRAKIQYASDKAKAEAEPLRAALSERLDGKEQQIQGLAASLDKASEEIKKLQNELKSEAEKRAAAERAEAALRAREVTEQLSAQQVERDRRARLEEQARQPVREVAEGLARREPRLSKVSKRWISSCPPIPTIAPA